MASCAGAIGVALLFNASLLANTYITQDLRSKASTARFDNAVRVDFAGTTPFPAGVQSIASISSDTGVDSVIVATFEGVYEIENVSSEGFLNFSNAPSPINNVDVFTTGKATIKSRGAGFAALYEGMGLIIVDQAPNGDWREPTLLSEAFLLDGGTLSLQTAYDMEVADLDGDGLKDDYILVTPQSIVTMICNDDVCGPAFQIDINGALLEMIEVVDLNQDGLDELVALSNPGSFGDDTITPTIHLYLNIGTGNGTLFFASESTFDLKAPVTDIGADVLQGNMRIVLSASPPRTQIGQGPGFLYGFSVINSNDISTIFLENWLEENGEAGLEIPHGADRLEIADFGPITPRRASLDESQLLPKQIGDGEPEILIFGSGINIADPEGLDPDNNFDGLFDDVFDSSGAMTVIQHLPSEAGVERRITSWPMTGYTGFDGEINANLLSTMASSVVFGYFNSDDILDAAIIDSANNQLIIMRGQPEFCATYVTAMIHGNLGETSLGFIPPQDWNLPLDPDLSVDVFTKEASRQTRETINAMRRPGIRPPLVGTEGRAMCPIGHIEVRGHWENQTVPGGLAVTSGRVLSLASSAVPSICTDIGPRTITPLPALNPITHWLSAPCLLLPAGSAPRFIVSAVGAGFGMFGRTLSEESDLLAAGDFATEIISALSLAKEEQHFCDGHVYLDSVSVSRGSPVHNRAMRIVAMNRNSKVNTDTSATYLAAIDASPFNRMFPWTRAGYMVGNDALDTIGNELISSHNETSAIGIDIPLTAFWAVVGNGFVSSIGTPGTILNFYNPSYSTATDIIGLPKGHRREDGTSVFPGYDIHPLLRSGRISSFTEMNLDHASLHTNNERGYMVPRNFLQAAPNVPAGSTFGVNGFLGQLARDPRQNENLGDLDEFSGRSPITFTNELGFHPFINPTEENERVFIPQICGGNAPEQAEEENNEERIRLGTEASIRNDIEVTEFIKDPSFSITRAMVRNSFLIDDDLLFNQLDKRYWAEPEFQFSWEQIRQIRQNSFVSDGVWTSIGGAPKILSSNESSPEQSLSVILNSYGAEVFPETMDVESQAAQDSLKTFSKKISDSSSADKVDLGQFFSSALDGRSDTSDAFLKLDNSGVIQPLDAASLSKNKLYVSVSLKILADNSYLKVILKGSGIGSLEQLDRSTCTVGQTCFKRFTISRDSSVGYKGLDQLILKGDNVDIFSISISGNKILDVGGSFYEVVMLDNGASWEKAESEASRREVKGIAGQLASFSDVDDMFAVLAEIKDSGFLLWTGITKTEGQDIWQTSSGAQASDKLWQGVVPQLATELPGYALLSESEGHLIGTLNRVQLESRDVGILVEYVKNKDMK